MAYRCTKTVWGKDRTIVVTRSDSMLPRTTRRHTRGFVQQARGSRELRGKLRRSQMPGTRGKGYARESLQKHLDTLTQGQYVKEILRAQFVESSGKLDLKFSTDQKAFARLQRTRLGKRIMCTDNDDWSTARIIQGCRAQHLVETAIRQMKNPHWVSFSPCFPWTDQKLRAHAFYCVLALLLTSLLMREAARDGIEMSVPALLEELSDVTEVTNLYAPSGESGKDRLRAEAVLSDRSPLQERLYKLFDVGKYPSK